MNQSQTTIKNEGYQSKNAVMKTAFLVGWQSPYTFTVSMGPFGAYVP